MPRSRAKTSRKRANVSAPPAWPADHVERRPVGELVPYARNSRTHSDDQIDQIVASIRQWGWTMPVLVDEKGEIIAGHARVLAARKLKLKDVPVMIARGWTEAQKRAYVIADNELALKSGWDKETLGLELAEIGDLDVALPALTGFSAKELERLTGTAAAADTSSQLGGLEYRVVVDARDEAHQAELLERFEKEGLPCRALIS